VWQANREVCGARKTGDRGLAQVVIVVIGEHRRIERRQLLKFCRHRVKALRTICYEPFPGSRSPGNGLHARRGDASWRGHGKELLEDAVGQRARKIGALGDILKRRLRKAKVQEAPAYRQAAGNESGGDGNQATPGRQFTLGKNSFG
jgi:hypothetical protein